MEDSKAVTKDRLIDKLRAIRDIEVSKAPKKMDADLVEECVDLLMDLEGKEMLSEDSVHDKVLALQTSDQKVHMIKKHHYKPLIIAACLAALLMLITIISIASETNAIDLLKKWGYSISEMFAGDTVSIDGITITKNDKAMQYSSVDEFCKAENLSVLYPDKLPNGAKVTSIYFINSTTEKSLIFSTSNEVISYSINLNCQLPPEIYNDVPSVEINQTTCYITINESNCAQAMFSYDNNMYSINTSCYDDLLFILNNLKENQ